MCDFKYIICDSKTECLYQKDCHWIVHMKNYARGAPGRYHHRSLRYMEIKTMFLIRSMSKYSIKSFNQVVV